MQSLPAVTLEKKLREGRDVRRLLATDYSCWPDTAKRYSVKPVWQREIGTDELRGFLSNDHRLWAPWVPKGLKGSLFAKIAVCSWKEWPWLFPYHEAMQLDLSRYCSQRMRTVLDAWLIAREPAYLRFFPFLDCSAANEYRFALASGTLKRSLLRHSHNGVEAAKAMFDRCASELPEGTVDIGTRLIGSEVEAWIIEFNP
jgi:hypothetical protein